jgi:hypothetical protein
MTEHEDLHAELRRAEAEAWNALAHGKYAMFGYWAAWHVKLRKLLHKEGTPSPFADLRALARGRNQRVTAPDLEPFELVEDR